MSGPALSLVPAPPVAATLYALEARVGELVEAAVAAASDPESQCGEELFGALTEAVEAAAAKRDRVAQFFSHLESQIDLAKREEARLAARRKTFEAAHAQLERYVIGVIQSLGVDAAGKHQRLEGNVSAFRIQPNPSAVEITDEEKLPALYQRATVTMSLEDWRRLLDKLDVDSALLVERRATVKTSPDKVLLKPALERGPVDGARIAERQFSLRRS